MGLRFTVLIIQYACFPHVSTMRLYINFNQISVTIYLTVCILYMLQNLQAKITTYYRTHVTQQSKSFYNANRRLFFS